MVGNLELNCEKKIASDVMEPLIRFYMQFQLWPSIVLDHYTANWTVLQQDQNHFYTVRERFNKEQDPKDFYFLCRTSHNGIVRFNKKGEYNGSLGHAVGKRGRGATPNTLAPIFTDWTYRLRNVEFQDVDYSFQFSRASEGDFVYCDPPYVSKNSVYGYDAFDINEFADSLKLMTERGVKWLVSYYGEGDPSLDAVALKKELLESGQSSFRKLNSAGAVTVHEALYSNYVQDNSEELPLLF